MLEYANLSAFPAVGESGKIYVALDTNLTYRWSGSAYIEISKSLALGETSDTAYRGDRGKTAYDHSQTNGNPHNTTAAQISNAPAGTISATTVQGAINELASDIVQVETDLNTLDANVNSGYVIIDVFDKFAPTVNDYQGNPSSYVGYKVPDKYIDHTNTLRSSASTDLYVFVGNGFIIATGLGTDTVAPNVLCYAAFNDTYLLNYNTRVDTYKDPVTTPSRTNVSVELTLTVDVKCFAMSVLKGSENGVKIKSEIYISGLNENVEGNTLEIINLKGTVFPLLSSDGIKKYIC